MYVKIERPLDPFLAAAALLPFDDDLPPLELATQKQIDDFDILFSAALMRPDETERPPFDWFKSGGNESDHAKLRYQLFLFVRKYLRAVAEANAREERPEGGNVSKVLSRITTPVSWEPLKVRTGLRTGLGIHHYRHPWENFENSVEQTAEKIWDLRLCPICSVPFLPRREDQKACTLKCSNVFRLRNHRAAKMKKQKRAVRSGHRKSAEQ